MYLLIEFLMFVLALPALLLYMVYSMFTAVADFFGWTLIPGVLGLNLGASLYILGRPDPSVEWVTVIQKVAGITVAGIEIPFLLVITGTAFLVLGAILRLSKWN